MTVRKKENRKQRTYGPSSLKGGDYAILPSLRGTAAEGGRGSLTHHLELELANTPVRPGGRKSPHNLSHLRCSCFHYREPRAGARGYILPPLRGSDLELGAAGRSNACCNKTASKAGTIHSSTRRED